MIKKLSLKDFKTYKDTEFVFSPGINVITGDTGNGKTNILLALQWVVDDRPRGNGCIRRGQAGSTVGMEVVDNKDKCRVIRKRNKSENTYNIEKDGLNIDPFKTNFPPEEVSNILNLSDINIQKQRQPYFLVYSSPGQVATYIRSITKLDDIDKATKILSGKIRSEKNEISHRQGELKSTNDKLVILSKIDLESLESQIDEAKNSLLRIERIREKVERIRSIITALKILESHRIILPENLDQVFSEAEKYSEFVIESSKCISKLKILIDKIKEVMLDRVTLPDNLDQIFSEIEKHSRSMIEVSKRISKLSTLLNKIKQIELSKVNLPGDLEILSSGKLTSEEYDKVYKKIDLIVGLLEQIYDIQSKISNNNCQLKQLGYEEKQLMEELDTCPSCGAELTDESKKCLLEGGVE